MNKVCTNLKKKLFILVLINFLFTYFYGARQGCLIFHYPLDKIQHVVVGTEKQRYPLVEDLNHTADICLLSLKQTDMQCQLNDFVRGQQM